LRKKVIAIDFDGTIAVDDYPNVGPEISGAIDSIKEIQSLGVDTVLWTCRGGVPLDNALSWLSERGVEFEFVNENTTTELDFWGTNPRKIAADIYIDDRVVGGFVGWTTVLKEIKSLLSAVPETLDQESQDS
jgi:hypothetical protein